MKKTENSGVCVRIGSLILGTVFALCTLQAEQCSPDNPKSGDYVRLYTTNNITLRGKIAQEYGDNLNTGTLLLEMKKDDSLYGLNLAVYTQAYPELSAVGRIDTLEGYYGTVLDQYGSDYFSGTLYLSGQCIVAGDFGGEALQGTIHTLTDNAEFKLPYSTDRHATVGVTLEADTRFAIDLYQYGFSTMKGSLNLDGSGLAQLDIGTVRHYRWMEFKILLGIRYISPLKQELVERVTVERVPKYAIIELGLDLNERVKLLVGSKVLGDNPLGNQPDIRDLPGEKKVDDPFTYLNIFYTF